MNSLHKQQTDTSLIVKRLGLGLGQGSGTGIGGLGLWTGDGDGNWEIGMGNREYPPVPADDSIISQATHPLTFNHEGVSANILEHSRTF